jgi:hypothetical protein
MSKFFAILAIVGFIVTVALFAVNNQGNSVTYFNAGVTEDEKEFMTFIAKYKKSYLTKDEYTAKLYVFRENLTQIKANTDSEVVLAVNKFTDLSPAEFKARYNGLY